MTSSRSSRAQQRHTSAAAMAGAIVSLLLPGCVMLDRPAWQLPTGLSGSEFWELGVYRLDLPGTGSVLYVGDGKFITCRHLLPPGTREIGLADGKGRALTIVGAGDYDRRDVNSIPADWVVFELTESEDLALPKQPPVLDFQRELKTGQEVFLVGFYDCLPRYVFGDYRQRSLVVLPGRVSGPPFLSPPAPRGLIFVDTLAEGVREGISGAAAAIWDDDTQRLVVVGICQGYREVRFLGLRWGARTMVVRPAPAAPVCPGRAL